MARDVKTLQQLSNEGFRVAVVWECSLKNSPDRATERLVQFILGNEEFLEIWTTSLIFDIFCRGKKLSF